MPQSHTPEHSTSHSNVHFVSQVVGIVKHPNKATKDTYVIIFISWSWVMQLNIVDPTH